MTYNKDHPWRPCTYCTGISHKMLHSHYGGKMEEFCRPHCMSQYTVLYYGVRKTTLMLHVCYVDVLLCVHSCFCPLFVVPLCRWVAVTVAENRVTWLKNYSAWVQFVTFVTCLVSCTTATYILRQASTPAAMVPGQPHKHHMVNCDVLLTPKLFF